MVKAIQPLVPTRSKPTKAVSVTQLSVQGRSYAVPTVTTSPSALQLAHFLAQAITTFMSATEALAPRTTPSASAQAEKKQEIIPPPLLLASVGKTPSAAIRSISEATESSAQTTRLPQHV